MVVSPAKPTGGFTLVELLIVVVALGILAAMVVPQFSTASTEAMESQLRSNIRLIRYQISLYQAQHSGKLPHLNENGQVDYANAVARLTGKTNLFGKVTDDGDLGPYLNQWPSNPFAEEAVADKILPGTDRWPPRNGKTGWYYCIGTGVISANSTEGALELDPP